MRASTGSLAVALALGLVVACTGQPRVTDTSDCCAWPAADDSGQPAANEAAPPDVVLVSSLHRNGMWRYKVEMSGWTRGVELDIYQATHDVAWQEHHRLNPIDADNYGQWAFWGLRLWVAEDAAELVEGETTCFGDDDAAAALMSWRVRVYDDFDLYDCVVWGYDISSFSDHDCREIVVE